MIRVAPDMPVDCDEIFVGGKLADGNLPRMDNVYQASGLYKKTDREFNGAPVWEMKMNGDSRFIYLAQSDWWHIGSDIETGIIALFGRRKFQSQNCPGRERRPFTNWHHFKGMDIVPTGSEEDIFVQNKEMFL